MALEILYWIVAAGWLLAAIGAIWSWTAIGTLPAATLGQPEPRVSVIVPARDEAQRIETTVRRLLAQRGIDLELIVVDDRSTDETSAILRRLAAENPHIRHLRIDALPDGWLGKCHACQTGAAGATGGWILFTDADVWLSERAIARAVQAGESQGVEHVVMVPGFARASFLGKATLLSFMFGFARSAGRVNRDRPGAFIGAGAFNLVRAVAYRAVGAHERLRLEVVDDLKLGLLLSAAGKRTRAYFGGHDVEVEWGGDVRGIIGVLRKNTFAMLGFRAWMSALVLLWLLVPWGLAIVGPFTGSLAGIAAGAGLASFVVPCWLFARWYGWSIAPALIAPFMLPIFAAAIANSTVATLREGGVRWRDTFYPLDQLRAGLVRWPKKAARASPAAE